MGREEGLNAWLVSGSCSPGRRPPFSAPVELATTSPSHWNSSASAFSSTPWKRKIQRNTQAFGRRKRPDVWCTKLAGVGSSASLQGAPVICTQPPPMLTAAVWHGAGLRRTVLHCTAPYLGLGQARVPGPAGCACTASCAGCGRVCLHAPVGPAARQHRHFSSD